MSYLKKKYYIYMIVKNKTGIFSEIMYVLLKFNCIWGVTNNNTLKIIRLKDVALNY